MVKKMKTLYTFIRIFIFILKLIPFTHIKTISDYPKSRNSFNTRRNSTKGLVNIPFPFYSINMSK